MKVGIAIFALIAGGLGGLASAATTQCDGAPFLVLDDFRNTPNDFGGSWFAFTDTSSNSCEMARNPLVGSSFVVPNSLGILGQRPWAPIPGCCAAVKVQLEKNAGAPIPFWHRDAGWAMVGMTVPGSYPTFVTSPFMQEYTSYCPSSDLSDGGGGGRLQAIGFDLYLGSALKSVDSSAAFDASRIPWITFRVMSARVTDSGSGYEYRIPTRSILDAGGRATVCVPLDSLRQPAAYEAVHGRSVLVPDALTSLTWGIQIEDGGDTTLHRVGPVSFGLTEVRLYGLSVDDVLSEYGTMLPCGAIDPVGGISNPNPIRVSPRRCWDQVRRGVGIPSRLQVRYTSSPVVSYAVKGDEAQLDVLRLDGSRVYSGSFPVVARELPVPVALLPGTYLVSVRGDGARQTAVLNVVQ